MRGKALGCALVVAVAALSGCMSTLDATSYDFVHAAGDERRVALAEEPFVLSGEGASWSLSVAVPSGVEALEVVLVLEEGNSFDLRVSGLGECRVLLEGPLTAGGAPLRDDCPPVEKGAHTLVVGHARGEAAGTVTVFAVI